MCQALGDTGRLAWSLLSRFRRKRQIINIYEGRLKYNNDHGSQGRSHQKGAQQGAFPGGSGIEPTPKVE